MIEQQQEVASFVERYKLQAKVFGGGLLSFGLVDLIAHGGLPGLFFGGAAAFVIAKHSPDLSEQLNELLPVGVVKEMLTHREPGSRSVADRLLGRHPDETPLLEEGVAVEGDVQNAEAQNEVVSERVVEEGIFPAYPDDEVLELGEVLATGQRFDPHFNQLSGKGFIASAVQGSGKSQLLGRIIEQGGKCGAPMIVLDHKGEYAPILDLPFIRGVHVGSAELRGCANSEQFFELTVQNVDEFVGMVMEGRYQAIIDLPSYGGEEDAWLPKAKIVAAIGRSLMRYAIRQRKIDIAAGRQPGSTLLPCWILLDEAQLYLPQNVNLLPPEARKDKEILDTLNNAYFSLVSNGRSAGYTVGFATQSLTYIAKWAIKSCQIRLIGRHVERNDLDMCEEMINPKVATREQIESFSPGCGVIFGFTKKPMVVRFDLRESEDYSETPGIDRLRAPRPDENDVQLDQLLAAIMNRPDVDQDDKRYESGNSVYKSAQMGNRETSVYTPSRMPVNSATSAMEPLPPNPRLRLLGNAETPEIERENTEEQAETGNVNATTRDVIKRMVEANFKHREIAAIVRLNGRKYEIYKRVCREMGIVMEKEGA